MYDIRYGRYRNYGDLDILVININLSIFIIYIKIAHVL